jgi:hypothetical protein
MRLTSIIIPYIGEMISPAVVGFANCKREWTFGWQVKEKALVTRSRVMGQVYIAVVAIMFLVIIKWVSMQIRIDKHIRTGILRE